ncbi:MAG: hypothetical protein D6744_00485, partial [Planctomycetota bacterium]
MTMKHLRMRSRIALSACAALICIGSVHAQTSPDARRQRLESLIERIASGDEVESADAADALLRDVVDPLAEAIGSLESRPLAEQIRITDALRAVHAELRVRLMRADLPPEDRELFDAFNARYPQLVRRLYDDDAYYRLQALQRLPLEPGTGASVLIAEKVADADEEVVETALRLAAQLKDDIVARGLTRFIRRVMDLVDADFFQPPLEEVELVLGIYTQRCITVLGAAHAKSGVPEILRAVRHFGRKYERNLWDIGEVCLALGEIGDARAVPVLLEIRADRSIRRAVNVGPGQMISQTHGDAALLALLRIYGLDPSDYRFRSPPNMPELLGFVDDADRTAAHTRFTRWLAEHAAGDSTASS